MLKVVYLMQFLVIFLEMVTALKYRYNWIVFTFFECSQLSLVTQFNVSQLQVTKSSTQIHALIEKFLKCLHSFHWIEYYACILIYVSIGHSYIRTSRSFDSIFNVDQSPINSYQDITYFYFSLSAWLLEWYHSISKEKVDLQE